MIVRSNNKHVKLPAGRSSGGLRRAGSDRPFAQTPFMAKKPPSGLRMYPRPRWGQSKPKPNPVHFHYEAMVTIVRVLHGDAIRQPLVKSHM